MESLLWNLGCEVCVVGSVLMGYLMWSRCCGVFGAESSLWNLCSGICFVDSLFVVECLLWKLCCGNFSVTSLL